MCGAIVLPNCYPQVNSGTNGITVKTTPCKRNPADGKSDRNGGKTRANGWAFTQWKVLWFCVGINCINVFALLYSCGISEGSKQIFFLYQ